MVTIGIRVLISTLWIAYCIPTIDENSRKLQFDQYMSVWRKIIKQIVTKINLENIFIRLNKHNLKLRKKFTITPSVIMLLICYKFNT